MTRKFSQYSVKPMLQTVATQPQQTTTSSRNSIPDVSFYSSLSSSSLTSVTASVNGPSNRNQVNICWCSALCGHHFSSVSLFFIPLFTLVLLLLAPIFLLKCSGGEPVSVRELCGVCHLGGGDLTRCLQCLESFHVHCHFSKWVYFLWVVLTNKFLCGITGTISTDMAPRKHPTDLCLC